jgi:phage FluMu protein Com
MKEVKLRCTSCNKVLLEVVEYGLGDKEHQLLMNCPFCKNQNVVHSVVGNFGNFTPTREQYGYEISTINIECPTEGSIKITLGLQ